MHFSKHTSYKPTPTCWSDAMLTPPNVRNVCMLRLGKDQESKTTNT
jgi:hypothetical protein